MAAITPRKNKSGEIISYTIRVYRGYDSAGKRLKPYTMTWKPESGMTPKQVEKELNRQAVQFEEQCSNGGAANPTMKLADFCTTYLEIMKPRLSPATSAFYKRRIEEYIIPALGHMKMKDIATAHVQAYIQQLAALPKSTGRANGSKTTQRFRRQPCCGILRFCNPYSSRR